MKNWYYSYNLSYRPDRLKIRQVRNITPWGDANGGTTPMEKGKYIGVLSDGTVIVADSLYELARMRREYESERD